MLDMKNEKVLLYGERPRSTYVQSANVFFHCMKKYVYLEEIIMNQAVYPRYNIEDLSYLQLDGYDKIAIPMVCFCDIHFTKLKYHMKQYGKYGIGLEKNNEIENGLTPIYYVNENSSIFNDYREAVQMCFSSSDGKMYEPISDFVIHQLMYTKPLYGTMWSEGKMVNKNFHDEKEWRYVPDMRHTDLPPIIIEKKLLSDDNLELYNDSIRHYIYGKMNIEFNDIKYLLIPNEDDRDRMIKTIMGIKDKEESEKYRLISKIITYDELEDDL